MPETDDSIDWQLVERHLAGETTPTEDAWLRKWLDADPSRQRMLQQFQYIWAYSRTSPSRYDVDQGWAELQRRLGGEAVVPVLALPRRSRAGLWLAQRRRTLIRIAAVLVVAAGGGVITETVHQRLLSSPEAATTREVSTGRGQRATVQMADGSRVVLGPETRLVIPTRFDRNARAVTLEGEGFFEVARDPNRPFLVRAGAAMTRVLGTSFIMRAYRDDAEVLVAVRTGSVKLHAATDPDSGAVLARGQAGRLGRGGRVAVESNADVDAYLAWTRDRLVFMDAPLRRVAADLGRWYDIEVAVVDSAIADFPLTAVFDRQSLDEVLTVISRSLGVRHAFDGRTAQFRTALPDR